MAASIPAILSLLLLVLLCCINGSLAAVLDSKTSPVNGLIVDEKDISFGCSGDSPNWIGPNGNVIPEGNNGNGIEVTSFGVFSLLEIIKFSPELAGVYICSDSNGNENLTVFEQEYSLSIVGALPRIQGDSVDLICNFSSPDRNVTEYKWTGTNQQGIVRNLSNATALFIDTVPDSDSGGMYMCQVTLNTKLTLTTSVNISIILPPVLNGSSNDTNITVFTNETGFQLPCNIEGDPVQFTWTMDGVPIVNNPHYVIDSLTGTLTLSAADGVLYSDSGRYECTGSNDAGSQTVVYNLLVHGLPNITSIGGTMFTKNKGVPLSLPCAYESNPTATVSLGFVSSVSQEVSTTDGIVDPSRYTVTNDDEGVVGVRLESLELSDNGVFYCIISNSLGSVNISYTVTVYGVPDVPDNVVVSNTGPESVTISWDPFQQQGLSQFMQPDYHSITWTQISNGYSVTETIKRTSQFVINGLIPSTEYSVRVSAINRAGFSDLSETVLFTTAKSAPRLHYFNVTTLDGGRSLRFDWLILHDGGSPITTFTVILSSETTPTRTITLNVADGTHLVTELEPNVVYTIQALIGNIVDSSLANYTATTLRGPPTKPSTPTVSNVQLTSAWITFDIPSIGSDPVDYYLVNVSSGDSIKQIRIDSTHSNVVSTTSGSLEGAGQLRVVLLIDSLNSDTSYSFSVSGGGAAGRGPFSEYSETVKTNNAAVLYYIIIGVVVGSIVLIVIILLITAILIIVSRRRRKRIGQKHTITDRIHEPTNFGFPNSSISETVHIVEGEENPPSPSSIEDRKDEATLPPPYPGYFKVNHQRTHSVSSTTSSQMCRKPDYLRSPSDHVHGHLAPPMLIGENNCNDSAYGGSAEKVVNHIYHEIPPSAKNPLTDKLSSHSFPSIHRVTSYDVDKLPPTPNCATYV